MCLSKYCLSVISIIVLVASVSTQAAGLPVEFIRILGDETEVPGYPEFHFPENLGGQSLQFEDGKMSTGTVIERFPFDLDPIFLVASWSRGGLEISTDSTDPAYMPLKPDTITLNPVDIGSDGREAVLTIDRITGRRAIHSVHSGVVTTLVSNDATVVPGADQVFTSLGLASYVGSQNLVFEGIRTDGESGIYGVPTDGSGEAFAVVDQSTPFPTFNSVGITPSFFQPGESSGDRFTFRALDSFRGTLGLYASDLAGNVTPVAEFGEPMPGGVGRFRGLGNGTVLPSMDGDLIAFATSDLDSDLSRIFITDSTTGETEILLDNTEIPTSVPHPNLFMPSISGDDVAFLAGFLYGQALLVNLDGVTSVLLESGDVLDGKVVDSIEISPFSFDDGQIAFSAFFTDNTSAIYVATVPGVWSGGVLVAGIGGLIGVRRRREALV